MNHRLGQLLVSQASLATLVPCWVGPQPFCGKTEDQLPAVTRQMNHFKDPSQGPQLGFGIPEKGRNNTAKFTIFPGTVCPSQSYVHQFNGLYATYGAQAMVGFF
ncbi:hypothetical protein GW17_00007604 [Ensete ventricosum]|nr:hypothetical protein GW17_00007604 [Ensete ventricosum]